MVRGNNDDLGTPLRKRECKHPKKYSNLLGTGGRRVKLNAFNLITESELKLK